MKQKHLLASFAKLVSLNVLGMIALSCYILADTFFVSNGLGTNGLASLNLAISIYSVVQAIGLMIGIGGATKFAILKAQNEHDKANEIFTHSIFLGATIGIVLLAIGLFFSEGLSRLLGANDLTFAMTNTYLKTILSFAPFFILNNVLIAFIRNDNNPKLAMGGMLVGSLSNIILDYIFIFPLGMGMFGAAFATGLAPIISLCLLSRHFIKKGNSFHLKRCQIVLKKAKSILSLGLSSFVTEMSSGVVLIIFNIVILKLAGNVGVAAYGVVANLSLVGIALFVGIAQGMQPLISQSYARKDNEEQKQLLRYAIILSIIVGTLIYAIVNIFGTELIAVFNSENSPELKNYALMGFKLYFIGFIFAGVNIVISAFFSAAHDPKSAFIISIVRGFVAIIPLVFVFSMLFEIIGVWLVFPVAECITVILAAVLIRKMLVLKKL